MSFLIVGLFGMAGAVSRYLLGLWTTGMWVYIFPLGTLICNYLGCFSLGLLQQYLANRCITSSWLRLGLGTGFLGSFTTFSAFSVETVTLWNQEYYDIAIIYLILSAWGGLALVYAGSKAGDWLGAKKGEPHGSK
ncbi:fluoride efflux transporter CrcB [Brevibacillus daliensis]|uniref:fluoride efflux transporter CrcB n=1 Tax=Brevibacillus daliensis TaxID=2892995 RepID=UPI001E3BFA71|nr:fluoride efflux transporter CrcB [Brevibacillus daliensis]